MSPDSNPDRSRRSLRLLALMVVAIGVLIASVIFRVREVEPSSAVPAPGARASEPATRELTAVALPERRPDDAAARKRLDVESPELLHCLRRANGEALAGVRMYRGAGSIAGPSDAEGTLEVVDAPSGAVTLWAEGYAPVALRGGALPTEVAFDLADAALELLLLNGTAEHRVLRSLLEPRAPGSTSRGPWVPALEQRTLDVWSAERVPPGSYDVYVWVLFPDEEPRALSHKAVEVRAGESTRLEFDLAAPPNPEDSEADS